MSVIVANSIRSSSAPGGTFDSISAATAILASVISNTTTSASLCIGSGNIYIEITATPTTAYRITLPQTAPAGLQYFGFNGTTYQWMTPTIAGLSASGINNILGTNGTSFVTFAPAAVLANIGAQPISPTLTKLASATLYATSIFGTDETSAIIMRSPTQMLTVLGLSPASVPSFAGIATNTITAPAGQLTVAGQILASAGTAANSVVVKSQLDAAATGFIQQPPVSAYCTYIGTSTATTLTAPVVGLLLADGLSPGTGSRILVNNGVGSGGIYTVTSVGSATSRWVLSRAANAAQTQMLQYRVVVLGGSVYGGTSWVCSVSTSTQVAFIQDSAAPTLAAGSGIAVSANTISLATVGSADTFTNPTNIVVNAYGQIVSASSQTSTQVRTALNLITPTFSALTIGGIAVSPGTGTYDIQLPDSAPEAGTALVYDGTAFQWSPTNTSSAAGSGSTTVLVAYQTPPGHAGGVAAAATWTPYPLNTLMLDTAGGTVVSAGTFTIGAGTYAVSAYASFCQVGGCLIRLRRVDDSAVLLQGSTAFSASGAVTIDAGAITQSRMLGQIVLAAPSTLCIDYFAEVSGAAIYELGRATAQANIYGQVQLYAAPSVFPAPYNPGGVYQVQIPPAGGPVVLPPTYRTYYISGTAPTTFAITAPNFPDTAEIVVVNATTRPATFTTLYGQCTLMQKTKQIFTYAAALADWI